MRERVGRGGGSGGESRKEWGKSEREWGNSEIEWGVGERGSGKSKR